MPDSQEYNRLRPRSRRASPFKAAPWLGVALLTGCVTAPQTAILQEGDPLRPYTIPARLAENAFEMIGMASTPEAMTLAESIYRLKQAATYFTGNQLQKVERETLTLLETANLPPILHRVAATLYFSSNVAQKKDNSLDKSDAVARAKERLSKTAAWPRLGSLIGKMETPAQIVSQLAPTSTFLALGIAKPKISLGPQSPKEISEKKTPPPTDFNGLRAMLTAGKLWEAAEASAHYRTPRAEMACDAEYAFAQYIRGQTFRASQRRPEAANAYRDFVNTSETEACQSSKFSLPESEFVSLLSDGRLWAARLSWEQGDNRAAEALAHKVLIEAEALGLANVAFEALQVLVGRVGYEDFAPNKNIEIIDSFAAKFNATQEQKEWLALRTALFSLQAEKSDAAEFALTPLLASNDSSSRSTALYWRGRSYVAQNLPDAARIDFLESGKTDPLGYYDFRSGLELKSSSSHASSERASLLDRHWKAALQETLLVETKGPNRLLKSLPSNSNVPYEQDLLAAFLAVALDRASRADTPTSEWQAEWWQRFGIERTLLTLVKQSYAKSNDLNNATGATARQRLLQIAYASYLSGDFATSIQIAARVRDSAAANGSENRDEAEREITHLLLYPRPFERAFFEASSRCQVDVNLLYALARQESMFRADAKSPVGALGLMQLMPSTARRIFEKLGLPTENIEKSLLMPEKNALAGACYLADLLTRYSGNTALSAAAYNAGENAVDNWKSKRLKNNDEALFVEFIPFQETQKYVQRVLRNYANMNWIYREPSNMEEAGS